YPAGSGGLCAQGPGKPRPRRHSFGGHTAGDVKRAMRPLIRNVLLPSYLVAAAALACDEQAAPAQMGQYEANVPKTILELQPFRRSTSEPVTDAAGRRGTVTLVELNPNSNAWLLLQLLWEDPAELR